VSLLVAKVKGQVAGGGHGQHDDLAGERAAGKADLQAEFYENPLGGHPGEVAGDDRYERPPDASDSNQHDETDQHQPQPGKANAVALDGDESVGQQ